MHRFKVLLLISFLVPIVVLAQQAPTFKFKYITSAQGLSQNHVYTICQDHKGFLWFGTDDGLNKYDGYKITIYKNDVNNSKSLSNNSISEIYEDSDKNLWIGTHDGLNLYDRNRDEFLSFKIDLNVNISISYIQAIFEDRDKNLWIGSDGGLSLYNRKDKTFINYKEINNGRVLCIYEDTKGNLWLGTNNGGLSLLDKQKKSCINYPIALPSALGEDNMGNILVGTNKGLHVFDPDKRTFIKSYLNDPADNNTIGNSIVYRITKDSKGRIWIGTENGGLNLFDPLKGTFTRYVSESEAKGSLSNNSVSAIFEDNTGTMWVGVHRGGVNYFNSDREKFKTYQQEPCERGLSHNNIKSFCEDKSGKIWIGTDGGGLNLFDPKNKTFKHFRSDLKNPNTISSNVVSSICEDSEENLWMGTYNGGMNKLNKERNKFTHYRNDPNNPQSLMHDNIWVVFEDNKKRLWISAWGKGLSMFDRANNKFINYSMEVNNGKTISGNMVECIYQDSKDNIWVGTTWGLNLYNPKTNDFIKFHHEDTLPNTISHNMVFCMLEDRKGNLWIGTKSGLNLFHYKTNSFKSYKISDGLPSDKIMSILEDDHGNLWLGTLGGVSKFNPVSNTFRNFTVEDGLQANEFSRNASIKSSKGEMYFGGINGFNAFYPDSVLENSVAPPVIITDFQIFNKPIKMGDDSPVKENINETKEIRLSYHQSVFSFEFAALNYIYAEKNEYAYKMEGFDLDWNYVGTRRTATYTNLDPGQYTFKVKASNNDGLWNEEGTSIKIIITPPYWKTWWFKVLLLIVFLGSGVAFYLIRMNAIQRQKRALEQQVKERTMEVVAQKEEILIQREQLEELYVDVKDSIRAAQVLQKSILPSMSHIKQALPESFILYRPRDVVSGDFYWFDVVENNIILAAADCTGHGVSGAFMAINGHHLLNQSIYMHNQLVASEILNRVNESLIKELGQSDEDSESQDGMDIVLCILDKANRKLQYAGANNPLYILRNGEIIQIKADKFPLGLFVKKVSNKVYKFKNHEIQLQKGDMIYIFSDGYADQIGGPDGEEKFMYPRFRELLLRIGKHDMPVQLNTLEKNIDEWRGKVTQLDDILVIGFKV